MEIQDELSEIEVQIEDLLQRQASLQTRQNELETILKQNSTKSKDEDVNWDKTGKTVLDYWILKLKRSN